MSKMFGRKKEKKVETVVGDPDRSVGETAQTLGKKGGDKKSFWQKKLFAIGLTIILAILILLGSSTLYMNWYLHDKNNNKQTVSFVITEGENVRNIAKDLKNKGLIKNDLPFLFYLKYRNLSGQLIAGEYQFAAGLTPLQIIDILTSGRVASKKITIPEGWNIDEIGAYLEKNNIVTKDEFVAATKKEYQYDFLVEKPKNLSLEGYLFPDTYQISYNATAENIVEKMLKNFESRLTSEIKARVSASGMSLFEVVTLAAVVEKEVAKPEERKVVAGIFLSRLREDMALESDATTQYILRSNKRRFSYAETRTPSPYNTYLNRGLPVGPISNPGTESINAVLNPSITEYRYFFTADNVTYYSKTFSEHEEKIAKYLK